MMNRTSYLKRTLAVAIVGALFISALAGPNIYDKYRNRTYSNKGYLSEEDEMKLAEQVHQELQQQAHLVQDRSINEYVNSVGQRLARASGRPNIPWHFYVVDDKSINAFATLGGRVYVHTGLLAATQSESQLASVLGHEIGHIVGRHGLENVKKSQKYGVLAGLATIGGGIFCGEGGGDHGGGGWKIDPGGFFIEGKPRAPTPGRYTGIQQNKHTRL